MGKNAAIANSEIKLDVILNYIYQILDEAQERVGGRVIMLECENTPNLVDLYTAHGFQYLQTDELVQMYKIFNTQ